MVRKTFDRGTLLPQPHLCIVAISSDSPKLIGAYVQGASSLPPGWRAQKTKPWCGLLLGTVQTVSEVNRKISADDTRPGLPEVKACAAPVIIVGSTSHSGQPTCFSKNAIPQQSCWSNRQEGMVGLPALASTDSSVSSEEGSRESCFPQANLRAQESALCSSPVAELL